MDDWEEQDLLDEEEDDAFCEELYQRYLEDPEKDEGCTLEECKKMWGLE